MPSPTGVSTLSLHDALPISVEGAETPRLAVFVHGLFETERAWRYGGGPRYGDRLPGWTPVYVRYNSGRRISENGRELADQLEQDRKSTRLNSSHGYISYAVSHRRLHSFPTRRSSDLGRGRGDASPGRLRPRPVRDRARVALRRRAALRRPPARLDARLRPLQLRAPHLRERSRAGRPARARSEEHTSELQSRLHLVCRLPPASPLFPYTTLFRSRSRARRRLAWPSSSTACSRPSARGATAAGRATATACPAGRPSTSATTPGAASPRTVASWPTSSSKIGRAHV